MGRTLANRVAALDRARFRGRAEEIALLERVLDGGAPGQVVLLHGPGGMGKSALLRQLVERAEGHGFSPHVMDGREIAPVPGEVERALAGIEDEDRPLLVLDSYERMSGMDGWLRSTLLPSLPEQSRVVLAGRRPPAPDWFRDGWEHLAVELELGPMSDAEAAAMLVAYGLTPGPDADEIVRWARGWPLGLSLAASVAAHSDGLTLERLDSDRDVLRAVVARVARWELERGSFDVLGVAALARTCSAPLVAAVLPEVDPGATLAWLRELTFAERVGGGVSLHDLVRRALRVELEARDAVRMRDLRRRIADHVHARAVAGEPHMLVDLTELIDDRALRWGFGADGIADYRVHLARPGDAEELAPWYRRRPAWWRDLLAFFDEAADRVVLARDARDRLAGVSIGVTLQDPPTVAERDTLLGPWLAHARRTTPRAPVLLWRDATDLGRNEDPGSPVVSLMNTAVILGCGLPNVRYSYIPLDPTNEAAIRFSRSVGGRAVPELAAELDGHPLECHVIDHGDGGMLGQIRDIVYAELRLPVAAARPTADPVSAADVRDALRNLHRPAALARSPLATGATPEARAESVRALVRHAAEHAFGESPGERLLRTVLERGYLEPGGKHELIADELSLSRTAYFRRLAQASERVADWLTASLR